MYSYDQTNETEPLIQIEISRTGEIKTNAIGFTGTDCETATAEVYDALGSVEEVEHKDEYYKPNNHQTTVGRGQLRA